MTLRRATVYVGAVTLFAAWFSSAASVSLGRGARRGAQVEPAAAPAQPLSVERQARRLKERLAAAPTLQEPIRNPFSFEPVRVEREVRPSRAAAEPAPAPRLEAVPEPPLVLVGLAERQDAGEVVRIAVITSEGQDVLMAEVGTVLLERYTVTSIGHDAVELKELSTGRGRRLVFQRPEPPQ